MNGIVTLIRRQKMRTGNLISTIVPARNSQFLKRAAILSGFIFQMKRNALRLAWGADFGVERHQLGRAHIRDRNRSKQRAASVVEMRDQAAGKEHSERT